MPSPPSTDRLRQLNALLEAALELPHDQRAHWLEQLPPAHHALMPELRSLLARAEVETDGFLRQSVHAVLGVQGLGGDRAGDVIGPWRLLAELGQGGMSTVWRAVRSDGSLQREVALKLPHAGWAHSIAQRMARERDILASLEHPRIARLYDAGLTREGRPWLAMECVEGVPIDRHCRERGLPVAARLGLFLQVADAVSHAHALLVVHRDLKPSNILVTPAGEVRLLDFGVAKLMDDRAEPDRQLTRQLGRPVTPDYAAPELLGTRAVGTAADVYALGVVLFELLSDQRPYTLDHRHRAGLEQAALDADVPAVSSRASDAATRKALRGDLDTIVAKALRKEPAQRYASVEAFAADLRRHLGGEPVLAQAPSRIYRADKFVRRHWVALGATGAIGLSLLAGLGAAVWQASVARAEAARAEEVKRFIASIFQQAKPREGEGGAVLASALLAAATQRIETELAGNPRVAAELGVIVAEGFNALGEPAKGGAPLRAAVARAEQVHGPGHAMVLSAKLLLADSIDEQDVEGALRLVDEVLPHARAGLPATAEILTRALHLQSFSFAKKNQGETAIAALKEGIAVAERHLGPAHANTLRSLGLLSNTYGRFGQREAQLRTAERAMERTTALNAKRPDVVTTLVERWYAEALRGNERPGDAIPLLRRVLEDQRALDAADTPRVRHAVVQLGLALDGAGQQVEGLQLLREAVALEALHHPRDSDDRVAYLGVLSSTLVAACRYDEAQVLNQRIEAIERELGRANDLYLHNRLVRQARGLTMQGDFEAAARMASAAAERAGERQAPLRAEAWIAAAMNERLRERPAEAAALARRVTAEPAASTFRLGVLAAAAAEEGLAWLDLGDVAQAEPALRRSLDQYRQAQVEPSPRMAAALVGMARVHLHAGRAEQAQQLLAPLVQSWLRVGPDSPCHAEALHWSSVASGRMGRHDEAARQRQQARSLLLASPLPMLRALSGK